MPAVEDYTLEDATAVARRVIYELSGRRWIWPPVTTTERIELPPMQQWVSLEGRPVIGVASVVLSRTGMADIEVAYELENKHRLRFTGNPQYTYPLCGGKIWLSVTYTYGSPPSAELQAAIDILAKEILLGYTDPDECNLPDTVVSITRQGISMQMLNAKDFLDRGRVGITTIDHALSRINPEGVRRKSRVYSVNKPPPRRVNTTQAPWSTGS
ncbi:head-to-tail adaptor [Gordonia phage Forza]|uniref:Head-to-tail adaptor n=1 Tax=Gordonia phage Forza TaxID=2571247 RepID=A0A650EYF2_9CAUD|nr:head-tail adaptor [Gordonia phage Forza]QEM41558.1 head-to-tail adaptor [Gordonia phage Boopy]QGT55084.1 head-to-tail adaptor [Gordonia phage Forza]UXE04232.1 head-to-tail adaptor [Gordonia phage BlueNGold]WBF03872.1 head-to-tail adaptor [Gordonia phage Mareelih]